MYNLTDSTSRSKSDFRQTVLSSTLNLEVLTDKKASNENNYLNFAQTEKMLIQRVVTYI